MLRPIFALLLALTASAPSERSLADSDDDMAWLAVSEAERVRRIRDLIRAAKPRFAYSPGHLAEGPRYCSRLMEDFMRGVGVQPIEPVTIFLKPSVTPSDIKNWVPLSAIKRASETRRLDPSFSKAIERCAVADTGNFDRFYQLDVGSPAYRIYRLSRSINPVPDAELLYWSEYSPFASVAAAEGDSLIISAVGENADKASIVTGAQTLSLSSPVTIELTEGQSQRGFALVSDAPLDEDATLQVMVTTYVHQGLAIDSNPLTLSLTDAPDPGTTLTGDYVALMRPSILRRTDALGQIFVVAQRGDLQFVRDARNNLVAGEGVLVTDNVLFGTTGSDEIFGGVGNDLFGGDMECALFHLANTRSRLPRPFGFTSSQGFACADLV